MMPAALAQDASCPALVVEAEPAVTARWPGLPDTVRAAFEKRDDVDRCAQVTLTLRDGVIGIDVALPDGRSAHRSASRREDVVPALQPLLLVPEEAPSEPSEEESTSPAPPSPPAAASPAPETKVPATPAFIPVRDAPASASAPASQPGHLRIELSAQTGARIGDGRAGVLLGAVSFLEVSGWLVGFGGSVQRYRELDGPESAGALELALLGGRRFRFGTMALDLTAGTAAAYQGTSTFETAQPAGTGSQTPKSGSVSSTVPRLLLEARLAFGALSTLHTFVGIDGDVGPAQSPDASQLPNAPRLPTWTLGLALGATVGTP
jgi:hypothetical protein